MGGAERPQLRALGEAWLALELAPQAVAQRVPERPQCVLFGRSQRRLDQQGASEQKPCPSKRNVDVFAGLAGRRDELPQSELLGPLVT